MSSEQVRYAHYVGRRARVDMDPVVRVCIRGFMASDKVQARHRLPLCPNDNGLVTDFLRWMLKEDLHPAFPSTSGGGLYIGYFHAHDVPLVEEWLEEHNERDDRAEEDHGKEED